MRYLIIFIALILPATLSAQSMATIENDLYQLYGKVESAQSEGENVEEYSTAFKRKLSEYVTKYSATLTYGFEKLGEKRMVSKIA